MYQGQVFLCGGMVEEEGIGFGIFTNLDNSNRMRFNILTCLCTVFKFSYVTFWGWNCSDFSEG